MKWLKVSLLSFIVLMLFVSIAPAQQNDGVWYAKKGLTDQSNAATSGSMAWIKAKIGSGYGVIVLSGGVFTITGDLTLGKTITLKVLPGSSIYSADNDDLVIQGQLEAGAYPIFSGVSVDLKDANFPLAYAEWFGAVGDDDTGDDGVAIQKCISACNRVDLQRGKSYCAKTKINMASNSVLNGNSATLKGHDDLDDYVLAIQGNADLRYVNTEANFGAAKTHVIIRDLFGNPNDSPGFLKIMSAYYVTLDNLIVNDLSANASPEAGRILCLIKNAFHITMTMCSLHGRDKENTYGLYISSDGDSKGTRVCNNIKVDTCLFSHSKYNVYIALDERTGTTHLECGKGISTATIASGGLGYVEGELLIVLDDGAVDGGGGQVRVMGVDANGAVTSIEVYRKGFNYGVSNNHATTADETSSGSGCTINITAITNSTECTGMPTYGVTFLNNSIQDKKGKGTPHWGYAWYFANGHIGDLVFIGNKIERCVKGIYVAPEMGRYQMSIDGLNTSNTLHIFDFAETTDETMDCLEVDEEDGETLIPCTVSGPLGKVELRGIRAQTTKSSPDPPEGESYRVLKSNSAKIAMQDVQLELFDVEDYNDLNEPISGRYPGIWNGDNTGVSPSVVKVTGEPTVYYRALQDHTSSASDAPGTEGGAAYWTRTSDKTGWVVTEWATGQTYVKGAERGRWYNAFSTAKIIDDTYNVSYIQDNYVYDFSATGAKTIRLPEIKWSGMRLRFHVSDGTRGRLRLEPDEKNKFMGNGALLGTLLNGEILYSPPLIDETQGTQMGASIELVSDFYNGWWFINSITGTWSIYTP